MSQQREVYWRRWSQDWSTPQWDDRGSGGIENQDELSSLFLIKRRPGACLVPSHSLSSFPRRISSNSGSFQMLILDELHAQMKWRLQALKCRFPILTYWQRNEAHLTAQVSNCCYQTRNLFTHITIWSLVHPGMQYPIPVMWGWRHQKICTFISKGIFIGNWRHRTQYRPG